MKGRIDGLQVLKGGKGKGTIYFDKDAMHGALDLNECEVEVTKTEPDTAKQETALIMQVFDGMIADMKRWVNSAYDIGQAEEQAKWQEDKDVNA